MAKLSNFCGTESLDARSFFASSREDLKRNQFGFALGGPIRKDRIWFHGFYEGLRELRAFSTAGYSPTADMFKGDFAATGRIIYDPATFDPSSGIRQPFPGNAIPSSRVNRVAQNLLPYYLPGSSLSSTPTNIRGNPRNTLNDDQWGVRLDAAVHTQRTNCSASSSARIRQPTGPDCTRSAGCCTRMGQLWRCCRKCGQ